LFEEFVSNTRRWHYSTLVESFGDIHFLESILASLMARAEVGFEDFLHVVDGFTNTLETCLVKLDVTMSKCFKDARCSEVPVPGQFLNHI
jgi:hypothetical protein